MAATPPLQIRAEARTPPTPLHGTIYHDEPSPPSRYLTRSSIRKQAEASPSSPARSRATRSARTPNSPRQPSQNSNNALHSPNSTPKHKATRRVQVISPPSPDFSTSTQRPLIPPQPQQPAFLLATTLLSEGMLPTPVKTPKKKQISKSSLAPRALFQESSQVEQMAPSPRKSRKSKRYNGFSLESFSAEDDNAQSQIQIFTDSRDQVPEVDVSEQNPFIESPPKKQASTQKVMGTSKRRKINRENKLDSQVAEAIKNDDGIVYVL